MTLDDITCYTAFLNSFRTNPDRFQHHLREHFGFTHQTVSRSDASSALASAAVILTSFIPQCLHQTQTKSVIKAKNYTEARVKSERQIGGGMNVNPSL
jgi:hypothetical protein